MDVNRRGRSDIYWNRIRRLGGGFTVENEGSNLDKHCCAAPILLIKNYGLSVFPQYQIMVFCSPQQEINYSLPFFISRLVPSIADEINI